MQAGKQSCSDHVNAVRRLTGSTEATSWHICFLELQHCINVHGIGSHGVRAGLMHYASVVQYGLQLRGDRSISNAADIIQYYVGTVPKGVAPDCDAHSGSRACQHTLQKPLKRTLLWRSRRGRQRPAFVCTAAHKNGVETGRVHNLCRGLWACTSCAHCHVLLASQVEADSKILRACSNQPGLAGDCSKPVV